MYDCELLRERLCDMGFETEENEEESLLYAMKKAEQTIMNNLNCEGVPEELYFVFLDMAAGEYLAGKTEGRDIDVKSVSEGDLSVTYGDKSEKDKLIDMLFTKGREEMLAFRREKW